jgi:hypothetical protein
MTSRFLDISDQILIDTSSVVAVTKKERTITITMRGDDASFRAVPPCDCSTQEIADQMFNKLSAELRSP